MKKQTVDKQAVIVILNLVLVILELLKKFRDDLVKGEFDND